MSSPYDRNVTPEDRADIWEELAKKRAEQGDPEGAERARRMAQENREVAEWRRRRKQR